MLATSLALALSSPLALAIEHTWTGNGLNALWSTGDIVSGTTPNWTNPFLFGITPVNSDFMTFVSSKQPVNTNDYANLSVLGVGFAQGTAAFTLGGNRLTVGAQGIINNSSLVQTFNMPITVGALNSTWDGGTAGLSFNGGVNLGNNNLTLNNKVAVNLDSADVIVGDNGAASLTLNSGSSLRNINGVVGNNQNSMGVATVTGAGTTWANSGNLDIGRSGSGTLNISSGGSVTNTGGSIGYTSRSGSVSPTVGQEASTRNMASVTGVGSS